MVLQEADGRQDMSTKGFALNFGSSADVWQVTNKKENNRKKSMKGKRERKKEKNQNQNEHKHYKFVKDKKEEMEGKESKRKRRRVKRKWVKEKKGKQKRNCSVCSQLGDQFNGPNGVSIAIVGLKNSVYTIHVSYTGPITIPDNLKGTGKRGEKEN